MPPLTVKVSDLAAALDVSVDRIRALISQGYLCTTKSYYGEDLVLKSNPPERIPKRIVDRQNVMLWLAGLDSPLVYLPFSKTIEIEIHRISDLLEPWRTEQAMKMLLRFRDAEAIVTAITKMRANDVAMVEIKRLSEKYKRRLARMAGVEGLMDDDGDGDGRVESNRPAQSPQLPPEPRYQKSAPRQFRRLASGKSR